MADVSIVLEQGAGRPSLFIPDLPVWQGMRRQPGVAASHSFRLGFEGIGPLRQLTTPDFLAKIINGYAAEDYSFLTAPPGYGVWSNTLGDRKAEAVVRYGGNRKPGSVLEVGAGSTYVGEKLRTLLPSIRSYVAVDPAIAGSAPGVEVVRGYFPAPELEGRHFDLILGFHCLEHMPSPEGLLRDAAGALTETGAIIMTFPDTEAALERGDPNVVMHEHLTYFTRASVSWVAAQAGLRVAMLESSNDLLTVMFVRGEGVEAVAGLPETGLLVRAATALTGLVEQRGQEIADLLDQGHIVAFHGATNGLNNFLHLTKLGGHPGVRLFDGDAAKHGLFLPACAAPVGDPKDPAYAEAGVIFVSALSFFDAIVSGATQTHTMAAERLRRLEA